MKVTSSPEFANLQLTTGGALRTNTSATDAVKFQAYDVDGAAYVDLFTATANNTVGFSINYTPTLDAGVDLDMAAGNHTIGGSIGANTLTLGGVTSAVAIPGSLDIGATIAITGTIDDDSFATASATTLATSESIKAYVDSKTSITWSEVTGTTQAMAVENGYIANNASLVTLTLPATAAVGDIISISGKGAGLYAIAQNAGQTISFGDSATTTGAGGSLTAIERYNSLTLLCITEDTGFEIISSFGNFTAV